MSSNNINVILKDRFGLLWIATPEGVDKFDGKNFKNYPFSEKRNGSFESREVRAITEDRAGRLWVGAIGGSLYLYDRSHDQFTRYDHGTGINELTSNNITALCTDDSGKLWIGTDQGINIIDFKTGIIQKHFPKTDQQGKKSMEDVRCLFQDRQKRMWIGSNDGLYLFTDKDRTFRSFKHILGKANSLPSDSVNVVREDSQGGIWIGTNNGLCKLSDDGASFDTFHYDGRDPHSLGGNTIYTIVPDGKEQLWIGAEGGLNVMQIANHRVQRYNYDSRNNFSLNSKSVRCIYIDPNGIYWVGSYEGGLSKYDKNLTLFNVRQNQEYDPLGLNAPFVTAFAEGNNGEVYIGTDGGGLNLFHSKTGLFEHPDIRSRKKINAAGLPVLCLIKDHTGIIWIGTYDHGLFTYDPQHHTYQQYLKGDGDYTINQDQIFCLKEDSKGDVWIGTNGNGINIFDRKTQKFKKLLPDNMGQNGLVLPLNGYIRVIEEDRSGNIWIGSAGAGIAVFHPSTGKFTTFNPGNTGMSIDRVGCLFEDSKGNMWIGSGAGGLVCYHADSGKFTVYAEGNGLSNGVIHKILGDDHHDLWVSTNRGLSKFMMQTQKFINYTPYNGLQSNSFFNGSGIRTSDGTLYLGGTEGFNYFKTGEVKINKNIPSILLTGLTVNNKPVSAGINTPLQQDIAIAGEIKLRYKEDFSISYAALNFTSPQQNRYAYFMKGFNKDWIYAGSQTAASYTNLDPGTYTFMVKASNNDGIWNNAPKSIRIIIYPPFWRTTSAYLVYVFIIGAMLWMIRRNGIRKLQRKFQAEQTEHEAKRMHELDQMKIKFLTNLSHEFRTPISLILSPADQLLANNQDQQATGQINMIRRNARRLLNLVNQLLDFRKMEEHELKLFLADGEIVSFIQDITDSFQDLAQAKNINLNFAAPRIKVFVKFDPEKVERILFNLLSNAFKFTPAGGSITVSLTLVAAMDSACQPVCIQVEDTGAGISPQKKDLIFERFYQDEDNKAGASRGSGIGLSIVREFVHMHGGDISVESTPGVGSVFTVNLPLIVYAPSVEATIAEQQKEVISNQTHSNGDSSKNKSEETERLPHILIVEDDEDVRLYLKENLKKHYKISEAADGKDGWHKALSGHPELILSDITMPYVDGLNLTRKLKADKRTSHIPVILLTALAHEVQQLEGLETGASDYVTKPFNLDILHAKIKNLLKLNLDLKTTYTKQLKVSPSDLEIESSDAKFLNKVALYIEENLSDVRFSVEDLSNNLGMSRGAFYSKMLALTGLAPVEFIRSFKLERAARLLEESDLNVTQIAYRAGFATPHYFTKSFKAKYNMLPSEYKNQKKAQVGNATTN